MPAILINTPKGMEWLFNTHLDIRNLHIDWEPLSAMIHGNPDCPERIDLWPIVNPNWDDKPLTGTIIGDTYVFCG